MSGLRLARKVLDRAVAAAAGWNADVVLKTDGSGWILDQFCGQIHRQLRDRMSMYVSAVPVAGLRNAVVHFVGSECFYDVNWERSCHSSNAAIGTWWHGTAASLEPTIRAAASRIASVSTRLARVHVTCSGSRDIVRSLGVPEAKIALVPMGVDTALFTPPTPDQRARARHELSIPGDALVVGSFQKDGVGWAEGSEPKLIKGPDTLVAVLRAVATRLPIVALVPGPARGYVIGELTAAGIPFRAGPFVPIETFSRYYHACDAYLMPGREEGGPASVLEALATGTPLIAHRTGMAPDVVVDAENGFLVDVGDSDAMADLLERTLRDRALRERLARAAVETAQRYAWPRIAAEYERLYRSVEP
jgi:glycosyltransferase involved in cell wall biosynthesis